MAKAKSKAKASAKAKIKSFAEQSEAQRSSQIEPTKKKLEGLTKEQRLQMMGASGTSLFSGYIQDEYNRLFVGRKAYDTYDEMYRGDSTIFKTLLASQLPIQSADWEVRPVTDSEGSIDPRDQEICDFVKKNLFESLDGGFDQFLFEALNMLRDGVSVFEKVYEIREGKYMLCKLGVRLPSSIEKWETKDGQPGITQQLPQGKPDDGNSSPSIPADKLLIFTFRREGDNYAGVSMFRPIAKNWIAKKNLENFELIGYEKQFKGVLKMRVPSSTTPEDKDAWLDSVENFSAGNGNSIVLPGEGYDFEFEGMKLDGASSISEAIKRHDARITDIMLGLFMKLGESAKGSYGMAENNISFFTMGLYQVAKQICNVINQYLVKELVDLNYSNVTEYPKLHCGDLNNFDVDKVSQALDRFAKSGLLKPDLETEQRVREVMGLPPKKEDSVDQEVPEVPGDTDEQEEFHEHHKGCSHNKDPEFQGYKELVNPALLMGFKDDLTSGELSQLKKKSQASKGSLPRPLTFAEQKVNLPSMKKKISSLEDTLQQAFDTLSTAEIALLTEKIRKIVENSNVEQLDNLSTSKKFEREIAKAIVDVRRDAFGFGKDSAANELGVSTAPTTAEQKAIMKLESEQLAKKVGENMTNAAKLAVTQQIAKNGGVIETLKPSQVVSVARDALQGTASKATNSMKTLGVNGTINTGRGYITEKNAEKVYAYQYSAILDNRTTNRCLSLDGRVVAPNSPEFALYTPPQHYNCRSIWVAILEDETFKPKIGGIPRSINPVVDINNSQDLKNPRILKNSAAAKTVQQELDERKKNLAQYEKEDKFPNRQEQHRQRIRQLERVLS